MLVQGKRQCFGCRVLGWAGPAASPFAPPRARRPPGAQTRRRSALAVRAGPALPLGLGAALGSSSGVSARRKQVHRVAVPDPAERKDGEDHGRDYASIALLEPVPGAAAAAALTCLVAVADYGRREVVAVRLAVGPATATVEFVHPVPARPLGLSSSSSSPAGVWVLDAEGVVTELSLAPPSAASPAHPPAP